MSRISNFAPLTRFEFSEIRHCVRRAVKTQLKADVIWTLDGKKTWHCKRKAF